jgi:transposase
MDYNASRSTTVRHHRPIGTAEELQRRRLRAVELVEQGESPDDVARFLGCGRSSVYTWVKLARQSLGALAAKPHPGPRPRLTAEQLKELEGLLLKGAKAHGWLTELGTAARAAELIERTFRVRFHPEHVRKLLKRRLRWTSQKPLRKAKERDVPDYRAFDRLPVAFRALGRVKPPSWMPSHLPTMNSST